MGKITAIMQIMNRIWAWLVKQAKEDNGAPYPLTQDEWEEHQKEIRVRRPDR